ncbi:MAG: glycosyltransferase family 2 protein [Treponema sp.]|jgi:GT2 family glycosyltransferase|nr:glycosyltransferase family 2 protein [Treponema sp.]
MGIDVSVIIVNYNTSSLLKNCIASIYEQTKRISFNIIVTDNNSSDDSVSMLRIEYPDVTVIPLDDNIGFGKANNLGALQAVGKYLFFLNSDTYLCNDAISILFDFMELNSECGICGGNLIDFSGHPIHSFDRRFPGAFSDIFLLLKKLPRLLYGRSWCYNYTGLPMEVAYITGADLMIRNELFAAVKGFDPFFFMYYEETELTVRIKKRGYRVYSVPTAKIAHKKGASLQYNAGIDRAFYLSKYHYMTKVYGTNNSYMAHFIFVIVVMIKIAGFAVRNKYEQKKRYRDVLAFERSAFNDLIGSTHEKTHSSHFF